jgi:hypothetical protein
LADLLRGGGGEVVVEEGFAHAGPDAFERGGQGAVEVEDDGFDWHVRGLMTQEFSDLFYPYLGYAVRLFGGKLMLVYYLNERTIAHRSCV